MKSLKNAWKNLEITFKMFIVCFVFYFVAKTFSH